MGVGALLKSVENLLAGLGRVEAIEREGGNAAQGHRRDRAQRPDPDPRCAQQIAVLAELADAAVGEDQLDRRDLGGDVAQAGAGSVGPGRDRAGDRLPVDVAEVLHRQPEAVEGIVEIGEDRSAAESHGPGRGVRIDHPAERGDVDHRALGQRRLGERVAGSGDADRPSFRRGGGDRGGELVAIPRATQPRGATDLVPGPVAPLRHRPRLISATGRRRRAHGAVGLGVAAGSSRNSA